MGAPRTPGGTILSVPYRKGSLTPRNVASQPYMNLGRQLSARSCLKFWIVIALVTGYLFFMDIPRSCLLDYIPRGLIWLGALYIVRDSDTVRYRPSHHVTSEHLKFG